MSLLPRSRPSCRPDGPWPWMQGFRGLGLGGLGLKGLGLRLLGFRGLGV